MQRNAPSLTPELWAKVFSYLEQRPDRLTVDVGLRHKQNQAEVHQLKLVCKQFKSIFESHPEIVQRLLLDAHFSVALVPSLLGWLHQTKGAIRVLQSSCTSSLLDVVMAGLFLAPNISIVAGYDVSACTVSLVGTYKRLEKCSFMNRKNEYLCLAPLGALPKLRQLMLQGHFKELHHLTGLTRLQCFSSRVAGAQEFPPKLRHLELNDSELVGVHVQTLPACTALTHLLLENVSLKGNNAYVYLDRNLSVVPTNIGQLTQLQTLHLGTLNDAEEGPVELKWVSELTSLQELSMQFDLSSGNIFQHVSLLTNLTFLDISGFDTLNEAYLLHVKFDWPKLQALRSLFIDSKRLHLHHNIFGLL